MILAIVIGLLFLFLFAVLLIIFLLRRLNALQTECYRAQKTDTSNVNDSKQNPGTVCEDVTDTSDVNDSKQNPGTVCEGVTLSSNVRKRKKNCSPTGYSKSTDFNEAGDYNTRDVKKSECDDHLLHGDHKIDNVHTDQVHMNKADLDDVDNNDVHLDEVDTDDVDKNDVHLDEVDIDEVYNDNGLQKTDTVHKAPEELHSGKELQITDSINESPETCHNDNRLQSSGLRDNGLENTNSTHQPTRKLHEDYTVQNSGFTQRSSSAVKPDLVNVPALTPQVMMGQQLARLLDTGKMSEQHSRRDMICVLSDTSGLQQNMTVGCINEGGKKKMKIKKKETEKLSNMKRNASTRIQHINNKTFVPIRAFRMAEEILANLGIVVIIGSPGSGKTTLSFNLMEQIVNREQTQSVLVTHPSQFEDIPRPKDLVKQKPTEKMIVLIDDIFGKSNLVSEFQREWEMKFETVWSFVESGFMKVIITFRTQIFSECQQNLRIFAIFNKIHLIDLHDEDMHLTSEEKRNILDRHLNFRGVHMKEEEKDEAVQETFQELGFPQCCNFFVSSESAQKRGVEFFKKPVEFLRDQFAMLKEDRSELGQYQYLVLLTMLFKEGVLKEDCLDPFEDSSDMLNLISKLKHVCKINSDVSLGQMKASAKSLCGLYLTHNNEEREYTFIHQSIFDTLFLQFISEYQKQGLLICPAMLLLEYIITPSAARNDDVVVRVERKNFPVLAERFTDLLSSSSARLILSHRSLKDEEFVKYLTEEFWKSVVPNKVLSQTLDIKQHTIPLLFHEDYFKNVWSGFEKHDGYFPYLYPGLPRTFDQKMLLSTSTTTSVAVAEDCRSLTRHFVKAVCESTDSVITNQRGEILDVSCFTGNSETTTSLLKCDTVPTVTTLIAAALSKSDDMSMFEYLLKCKTNADLMVDDFGSMLYLALEKGNWKISRFLIHRLCQLETSEPVLRRALRQLLLQCHEGLRRSLRSDRLALTLPSSVEIRAGDLFRQLTNHVTAGKSELCAFLAAAHDDADILKEIIGSNPACKTSVSHSENLLHTASRYGCVESTAFLVNLGLDITAVNEKKQTPLHLAAENNTADVVGYLLQKGGDPNAADVDGNSPLHLAVRAENLESVVKLVEAGAKLNVPNKSGDTPLHIAAEHNSVKFVSYLIQEGSKLTLKNNLSLSPLHLSLHYNKSDVIQYLVRSGSELEGPCPVLYKDFRRYPLAGCFDIASFLLSRRVDVKSDLFAVLLHRAVRCGDVMAVRFLLEKGVDTESTDADGKTVLHVASRSGFLAIIKLLLKHKANVNSLDKELCTPLHDACVYADISTVKELLKSGAKLEVKNKKGLTPLHLSVRTRNTDMIESLVKSGADINSQDNQGFSVLYTAVLLGMEKKTKLLINLGANVNIADNNGWTAISVATVNRKRTLLKVLQEAGGNVNHQDLTGLTPLHLATINRHADSISTLLELKADPYLLDNNGLTCLLHAAMHQNPEILQVLLDNDVNPDCVDSNNQTALYKAIMLGLDKNVELLLNKGSSPKWRDKTGLTPLHMAAQFGKLHLMDVFLKAGADINCEYDNGITPLISACSVGKQDVVYFLLDKGADPNYGDGEVTAMHAAASFHHTEILQSLLAKGGRANVTSSEGNSPLHVAVRKTLQEPSRHMSELLKPLITSDGSFDVMLKTLTEFGSLVDQNKLVVLKDLIASCKTPTTVNQATDQTITSCNVVDILLENGCCVNLRNKAGQTAAHVCVEHNQPENLKMLLNKGADVTILNNDGNSVLHEAVERAQVGTVDVLLGAGVVDVANAAGITAHDLASIKINSSDDENE